MGPRWMASTGPHKSGRCGCKYRSDNQTEKVWIRDICHRQIHGRKQISIMCNNIEHWVPLRCAGIRLAQYTDNGPAIYTMNLDTQT